MAQRTLTITDRIVAQMNTLCEEGRWFFVAGLARETWPALLLVMDQLHEVAQIAVQHYAGEGR